jgi:hypothetical protein
VPASHVVIATVGLLGGGLLLCAARSSEAKASYFVPDLEARLSLGHDSNLLDISDLERAAFESGDDGAFFVVDRMSDQFCEGELGVEWKAPRLFAGRPSLRLGWERRQYMNNPIKSEDHLTLGMRVRPGERMHVEVEAGLRPQTYARHRFYRDALPGEPQFRPEVYRRWDLDLIAHHDLGRNTAVEVLLEGSSRRYQAPFEERDRKSFGGGGGLTRSLGGKLEVRAGTRYRATWTRNDPWDPDDRSHRAWRASSGITLGGLPFLKVVSLDLELEWRRFTSTNPDDQDHFGRRDRGGEVDLEILRGLGSSLEWVNRATWRWRSSDFPEAVFDEEGVFEDAVFRTGVLWAWEQP